MFRFWFSPWSSPKDLTSIICSSIARICAGKCKRVELANYKCFIANIVNLQKMLQHEYLLCSLANSASRQTRRGFGKVKKPAPLKRPRWWYVTGTDWVSSSYTAVLTPGLTNFFACTYAVLLSGQVEVVFFREISERVGAFLPRSAPQAWHPTECFGLRTSMKTIPCAEYKHNSSAHSVLAIKSAHSIICHRTLRWQSWSPFHFQFGLGNSNFPHF